MKLKNTESHKKISTLSLTSIALASMLAASSAHAVPVADLPHTLQAYITHLMRYVRQGQEYAEQVEHHIRDVTHMRQQLITIPGLADVSMPMTDNFEERDPNYGMGAACPGAGSMSLSSLMSAFTLDLSGDIKEQQKQICQRIVLAKNTQYNEAVKMLKNVRQQDTQIKQIAAERAAAGESQGKLAANDNKLSQFLARSTASMQYSQTVITAYEAYINSLEDNQELLTKQAMTGNNGNETFATTVTRKFVQGVALEAALDSVSDRDR